MLLLLLLFYFQTKWNFPHCVGAIDGKHIRIKKPAKSGALYFNYKAYYSIIMLAVADAHCRFRYVNIGSMGMCVDAGIFKDCGLRQAIDDDTLNFPQARPLPNDPGGRIYHTFFWVTTLLLSLNIC